MTIPEKLQPFYQAFLAALPPGAPAPDRVDVWFFCNNEPCANELGQLCLKGIKTATASLQWSYQADEPLPVEGQYSLITDWDGNPLCVIQTTRVYIVPFKDVDAEQAYLEGEGDRSLSFWRDVHWRFFSDEAARLGLEPSEDMPVVCERFKVVFPLPA